MALDAKHKTQWEQHQQVQQQQQLAILQAHDDEKQQELAAAQQRLQEHRKKSASPPAATAAEVPIREVLLHNDDEWDKLLAQNSPDNVGDIVWAHMEAMYQSTLTTNTFQQETFQYEMGDEETDLEEDEEEMDQQQMHGMLLYSKFAKAHPNLPPLTAPCTSDLDRGTIHCKLWWARRPSNGYPGVDPDRVADQRCGVCHANYMWRRRQQLAQEKKKRLQEKRGAEERERREREAARKQQQEKAEPWLRVKRGLQQERERRIQYRLGEQRLQQQESMLNTPEEVADQDEAGWAPGPEQGGPVYNPENPWGDQRQFIEPAELLVPVGGEKINGEHQRARDETLPAHETLPTDETLPAHETLPTGETLPTDGTLSTEGTLPADETLPKDETLKRPHKKGLSFYSEDDDEDDDKETDEYEEEDTDEEDYEDYYEDDKGVDEEEEEYYKDFDEGLRAAKNRNAKRKHIENTDSGIGTEVSEACKAPQDENETILPSIETDDYENENIMPSIETNDGGDEAEADN
ncbi:hypothetical protein BJ166DRAFT_590785 [Pestalotiopsis sp. NC0098]|nr:hypothetical protein BJ166DRAFT_590785 [Pestalotiopsis sp. NC0098]